MNILKNYINGTWQHSTSKETIDVVNPANQDTLAKVPYGPETKKDLDHAVIAAQNAYNEWRNVPVIKRVQVLYR